MRLIESQSLKISKSRSKLSFTTTGGPNWEVWDRFISLGGERIFHIGNVCGTCEFFFRRLTDRTVPSFEIESTKKQLADGLTTIDSAAMSLAKIIPNGDYVVALFECQPQMVGEGGADDYFSCEQRLAWPDYADDSSESNCYYRGEASVVADHQMLFEFFVPLYDVSQLDEKRVQHYKSALLGGLRPTAVSLSVLDVKESMSFPEDDAGNEIEPEFRTHWCFANYMLDGHHKMFAAHSLGLPINILTFISLDHSWRLVDKLISRYKVTP